MKTTILGMLAATSLTLLTAHASARAADGGFALTEFRSPTGNIACVVLDGSARCDINNRTWIQCHLPADR